MTAHSRAADRARAVCGCAYCLGMVPEGVTAFYVGSTVPQVCRRDAITAAILEAQREVRGALADAKRTELRLMESEERPVMQNRRCANDDMLSAVIDLIDRALSERES